MGTNPFLVKESDVLLVKADHSLSRFVHAEELSNGRLANLPLARVMNW